MVDPGLLESGIALGPALRRLPLESPQRSAWPLLAGRVQPRTRRPLWALAFAASVLALLLLPRGLPTSSPEQTVVTADAATTQRVNLAALKSESARLERLVAVARDDGASSATAAAWSLELEDRLHALDSELEANRDSGRQLPLWRQRVQLLRSVAAVESSRRYLAAEGRDFDVALVSAY